MFERLAIGDESALQQIIDQYKDELLARIMQVVHNRYWAEEIQMDVFLELWEQRQKVGAMKYPRAWLFRVAINKAVDRFRKENPYMLLSLEAAAGMGNEKIPDDEIDANELKEIIALAIEQLSPKVKQVYLLSTQEQWPVKKIAEVLGRSPNTIRNELVASRKALIKIISNYLHLLIF